MSQRTDVIANLARFTPNGSGLDRDALIFAAGRASASRRTGWIAVASVLALAHVGSLALWFWPNEAPPTPIVVPTEPTPLPAEAEPSSMSPHSLAWAQRVLNQTGDWAATESMGSNLKPDARPLSVRSQLAWE